MEHAVTDIPRIYTALAEWSACVLFIVLLPKRLPRWRWMTAAAGALLVQSVFFVKTGGGPLIFWIPCMVLAVLFMVAFIGSCCNIRGLEASYFGIQAFVAAEFAASLEWQISTYFWRETLPAVWGQAALILAVYGVVFAALWNLLRRHLPKDGRMELDFKGFSSAIIIGIAVFAVSNLSFVTTNTPFSGQYTFEIANIRTLVNLGGVAMLYAHLVQCCEVKVRRELESVENVLQNQYQQYKQSRESIDLINYKYHDLKHQIAVLRSEQDPERRNEFLNKMEDEIRQYELQNKTGNHVLDTVLTSKTLYCDKHGITLTSVADGKLLEFMDIMDICSIFGNALDNAIECELKIPDKEKRLIHVTVTRQKNFLMIRFENYYEGKLNIKEGRFATTKKEKQFHGYGIKSIRYTANKYEGAVNIDTTGNWFDLKVLIPLPKEI